MGYGIDALINKVNFARPLNVLLLLAILIYIIYPYPAFLKQYVNMAKKESIQEQQTLLKQKGKNKVLLTNDYVVYWHEILGSKYKVFPLYNNQLPEQITKPNITKTNSSYSQYFYKMLQNNYNYKYYLILNGINTQQQKKLINIPCIKDAKTFYYGFVLKVSCKTM